MEELRIKIYLDDKTLEEGRAPSITYPGENNEDWHIVSNYEEFAKLISFFFEDIIFISFDHDLADFDSEGNEKTGMDCAKFLVDHCLDNGGLNIPEYNVHSDNTVGVENITSYLQNYKKSLLS